MYGHSHTSQPPRNISESEREITRNTRLGYEIQNTPRIKKYIYCDGGMEEAQGSDEVGITLVSVYFFGCVCCMCVCVCVDVCILWSIYQCVDHICSG